MAYFRHLWILSGVRVGGGEFLVGSCVSFYKVEQKRSQKERLTHRKQLHSPKAVYNYMLNLVGETVFLTEEHLLHTPLGREDHIEGKWISL